MRAMTAMVFTSLFLVCAASATAAETDWKKIDLVFGRPATITGAVHRYGLPRADLKVSLDGVQLKPGFALGGWVAFEPMGDATMMMGDLVLTEAEINPVMTKLLGEGLQVTAVHNHLLRANPADLLHACLWIGRRRTIGPDDAGRVGRKPNTVGDGRSAGSDRNRSRD